MTLSALDKPGQEKKHKENDFTWRVPIAQIFDRNFNLDVKNPHEIDDAHRDPQETVAEYEKAVAVREKLRKELEAELLR